MTSTFLGIACTPAVRTAQEANGSAEMWRATAGERDRFTEAEAAFISSRNSFYMASVSEDGWPYLQHRGGPVGFLRVLDDRTLGFADYRGNRQYISLGNLTAEPRVALFLMDYPRRARLKILARIDIRDLNTDEALSEKLAVHAYRAKVERGFIFHLEAYDWNCSQHITPRYTEAELAPALAPIRQRLAELEADNERLRRELTERDAAP